jgi:hypothetical protein
MAAQAPSTRALVLLAGRRRKRPRAAAARLLWPLVSLRVLLLAALLFAALLFATAKRARANPPKETQMQGRSHRVQARVGDVAGAHPPALGAFSLPLLDLRSVLALPPPLWLSGSAPSSDRGAGSSCSSRSPLPSPPRPRPRLKLTCARGPRPLSPTPRGASAGKANSPGPGRGGEGSHGGPRTPSATSAAASCQKARCGSSLRAVRSSAGAEWPRPELSPW